MDAFYPAPKEVYEEMYILRGEVLAAEAKCSPRP